MLLKMDVVGQKLLGTLELARRGMPQDVKLSPEGTVFYVADLMADGVYLVDGENLNKIGFIPTGKGAHGLYISRDSQVLYVSTREEGSVCSLIDFLSRKMIRKWQLPGRASCPASPRDGHDGSPLRRPSRAATEQSAGYLAWAWWFPKVRKAAESVDNTGTVKLPDNSRVENSPNAVLDMVYPSGGSEQHVTGHVKISNTSRPRRIAADSKKIRATKWNFAGISIPQVAVPQGFTGPFFSENKPAKSESHRQ